MRLGGSPRRVQSSEAGACGLISQHTHTRAHHVSINDMFSVKAKQTNSGRKVALSYIFASVLCFCKCVCFRGRQLDSPIEPCIQSVEIHCFSRGKSSLTQTCLWKAENCFNSFSRHLWTCFGIIPPNHQGVISSWRITVWHLGSLSRKFSYSVKLKSVVLG